MKTKESPRTCGRRLGFTLVELLVVIGIIALLISILLPSLQKARRAANTIKCAANLHSIMLSMQVYGANNKDYIPGSPNTTGRFLLDAAGTTVNPALGGSCPNIVAIFDWCSPIAANMGARVGQDDTTFVEPRQGKFNSGGDDASRLSRFEFTRKFPPFRCPENDVPAWTGFGTPGCATDISISYSMAEEFLLLPTPAGAASGATGRLYPGSNPVLPGGYAPKFGKIRNSQSKICMAEGSRYLDFQATTAPDYSLSSVGSGGGSWADGGAWTSSTRCWPRAYPGDTRTTTTAAKMDWRPIIYRHSLNSPGGTPGRYTMNCAFYDGHVSPMDDVSSSDPSLWLPSGSLLTPPSVTGNPATSPFGGIWKDTATKFGYTTAATTIP